MASLSLKHIYKVYPNGVKAVNDFTMDIDDKEFIVFVGPSGCGKSTTLRMIAGLEDITSGELRIGDAVVNDVEPKDRDIAMVFQNYALYPHMTVYENMAFGLKLRRVPKDEIDRRVKEAADILGISDFLDRKPKAMSGGQRQRVALGRAIVREPKVFLLDEPLSNLDAKLRTTMRTEISKLHRKLQTTFIYVTHDQIEAMTMGTRIVVMKDGFIQQIDTPSNLYRYPVNKFVAGFIGTPQMNFYKGKILKKGDSVSITFDDTDVEMEAPYDYFCKAEDKYLDGSTPVIFGIRAEHLSVDPDKFKCKAKCKVSNVEELGVESYVYADFNRNAETNIQESPTRAVIKAPSGTALSTGDVVEVSVDVSNIHVFDAETEKTIMPRIPEKTVLNVTVSGGTMNVCGSDIPVPEALKLPDGDYELVAPLSSVSRGKSIKVDYVDCEKTGDVFLAHCKAGGKDLYTVTDGDAPFDGVDLDLKRCGFYKDGVEVASPIITENRVFGKFARKRVIGEKTVGGKIRKMPVFRYSFEIEGASIPCPDEKTERILAAGIKNIFKKRLEFGFSPDSVAIAQEGFDAEVSSVKDYGNGSRYVVLRTATGEICVSCGDNIEGPVKVLPDADKISVYDPDGGIRLI